ncbi:ribose-5-phosphate isomerase RpiA [Entomobacter blattae]|uniref:Ribose-5-phosphate isomerase A n=1 Tax=Entomobacter blattae TaxID=2762277 RepID=A0A7H1NNW6_9PROT|nr:ribose-5-phosphate isomerase RpiA [Entomobacter blattae]QNT77476.1 Ribose-5-phosphate isomerase A [Entomobacter blattae]
MSDIALPYKKEVGEIAASLVQDGMIVGLGSGSTATCFVESLGRRVTQQGLRCIGIPTSVATAKLAISLGIELTDFIHHSVIDVTFDGADEIEEGSLNLIKGLGGALLREKIVAAASKKLVIVADETKMVKQLGEHTPVPVEVTPFGWESTAHQLSHLGAQVAQRWGNDGKLFITDGGNIILDCHFKEVKDARKLERDIGSVVGVVESGLFIDRTAEVLIAGSHGIKRLEH